MKTKRSKTVTFKEGEDLFCFWAYCHVKGSIPIEVPMSVYEEAGKNKETVLKNLGWKIYETGLVNFTLSFSPGLPNIATVKGVDTWIDNPDGKMKAGLNTKPPKKKSKKGKTK